VGYEPSTGNCPVSGVRHTFGSLSSVVTPPLGVAVKKEIALVEQVARHCHQCQQQVAVCSVVPSAENSQVLMKPPGPRGQDPGQLFHLGKGNPADLRGFLVVKALVPHGGRFPAGNPVLTNYVQYADLSPLLYRVSSRLACHISLFVRHSVTLRRNCDKKGSLSQERDRGIFCVNSSNFATSE